MPEGSYDASYFKGNRGRKSLPRLVLPVANALVELSERRISAPARAKIIAKLFETYSGNINQDKILDVGTGRFWFKEALDKYNIDTHGLDISSEGFLLTKSKIKDLSGAVQADALLLPYADRSFFLVSSSDLFEHLADTHQAKEVLNEMGRVGKKLLFLQVTPTDYGGGSAYAFDRTHQLGMNTPEWKDFFESWASKNRWTMVQGFWTKENPRFPPQPPAWVLVRK